MKYINYATGIIIFSIAVSVWFIELDNPARTALSQLGLLILDIGFFAISFYLFDVDNK